MYHGLFEEGRPARANPMWLEPILAIRGEILRRRGCFRHHETNCLRHLEFLCGRQISTLRDYSIITRRFGHLEFRSRLADDTLGDQSTITHPFRHLDLRSRLAERSILSSVHHHASLQTSRISFTTARRVYCALLLSSRIPSGISNSFTTGGQAHWKRCRLAKQSTSINTVWLRSAKRTNVQVGFLSDVPKSYVSSHLNSSARLMQIY